MFDKIISDFWEQAKKNGLSFLILCLVCAYFYNEVQTLKTDQSDCDKAYIEVLKKYKDDQAETRRVIERNTDAFIRLEKKLD